MLTIPFSGSKRWAVKKVREIVKSGGYKSIIEPFGGSGVITVNLYNEGLIDTGYINDYDHFFNDFKRALDYKDLIVKDCTAAGMVPQKHTIIDGKNREYIIKNGKRIIRNRAVLPDEYKKVLQDSVKKHVPERYYKLLSNFKNFTHPMVNTHEKITINDFTYYRRNITTTKHRKYLNIVERLHTDSLDYKDFIQKYPPDSDTLLIIDPPYIERDQGAYKGGFNRDDLKQLVRILESLKRDFIFFEDDKTIIESALSNFDNLEYFTVTRSVYTRDWGAYYRRDAGPG